MRISSLLASAALILSVSACGYASFTSSDAAADTAQEADTNQASTVTIDGTNFEISGFNVINPDEGADAFVLFFVANDVQRSLTVHESRNSRSFGGRAVDNPFPEANGREVSYRENGTPPQYMGGGTFNGTNELTIARTSDLVSVTGSVTLTEYDHDTDTFVNGNTLTVEFNVQNLAVFEPGPPPPAN